MKRKTPDHAPYLPDLDDHLRQARSCLRLVSLRACSRNHYQGKWFRNALDFAARCAAARDRLARYFASMPHDGNDIRAQARHITALEYAQHHYRLLLKDIDDTLLVERARLYDMATDVLRGSQALLQQPYLLAGEERSGVATCVSAMRREFDRRNQKIAETKRRLALPEKQQDS